MMCGESLYGSFPLKMMGKKKKKFWSCLQSNTHLTRNQNVSQDFDQSMTQRRWNLPCLDVYEKHGLDKRKANRVTQSSSCEKEKETIKGECNKSVSISGCSVYCRTSEDNFVDNKNCDDICICLCVSAPNNKQVRNMDACMNSTECCKEFNIKESHIPKRDLKESCHCKIDTISETNSFKQLEEKNRKGVSERMGNGVTSKSEIKHTKRFDRRQDLDTTKYSKTESCTTIPVKTQTHLRNSLDIKVAKSKRITKKTGNIFYKQTKPKTDKCNRDATKSIIPSWNLFQTTQPFPYLYVFLTVICLGVYVNGLTGEYVHDDISAIVRNNDVQGATPWWHLFLNDFWGRAIVDPESHKSYRPITILTFRWSHWIFGSIPWVDHLINVFLHMFVTILYAHILLKDLELSHAHALICGSLFATHPIHTEAVTGIVGRADLLAALMFLISFHSYHKIMKSRSENIERLFCFVTGVAAVIGVLCKENSVTVLGVCIAWDSAHWFSKVKKWLVTGKIPTWDLSPLTRRSRKIFFLGIAILMFRVILMRGSPLFSEQDNPAAYNNNTLTRFQTFLYLPAHNIWLMLFPNSLSYDWQMGSIPLLTSPYDVRNIGSIILYLCIVLLIISAINNTGNEGLAVWWSVLVLCLSFLPASNLFFTVGFVIAERILYIPSFGWCTLVGLGVVRLLKMSEGRNVTRRFLLLLIFCFSLKTFKRNLDWGSRETLFTSGVRTLPNNAKLHYNLANVLKDNESTDTAIYHYKEAIRLWWSYPSVHNNLGTAYQKRGDQSLAETHFLAALQSHPKHPHASLNLAHLWNQEGRTTDAINLLTPLFCPEENEMSTSINIGRLLSQLYVKEGRRREAEDVYLRLATTHPFNPSILVEYGVFLQQIDRSEEAVRLFESALSIDPSHKEALTHYGALSQARHLHQHAYQIYSRALEMSWEVETATSLARVCLLTERLDQAEHLLQKILADHDSIIPAKIYMAQVRLQQKQYQVSEDILQGVLKEDPHHREAYYQLSLVYSASNRSEEAVEAAMESARACSHPKDVCAILHAHYADLLQSFTMVEDAIVNYQMAVLLEPSLTRAHVNLGAIYHIQGHYTQAWDHYTTALIHDPYNSILLDNIEKLQRVLQTFTQR